MKFKDFVVEVRMVEKLAYHCYVKFPDILFKNKLSPLANEKILIRVDAMHKDSHVEPRLVMLDRFGVYRTINVNPLDVILSQKLLAILDREKGRDLFDISYIFSIFWSSTHCCTNVVIPISINCHTLTTSTH